MKISNSLEVSNLALVRLNQRTISSFEDDSPQAKICKTVYEQSKTNLLSQYNWTFAIKNTRLNKVSDNSSLAKGSVGYDDSLFGYCRKFALPEGFLRLVCVMDEFNNIAYGSESAPFVLEGKFILTNLANCKLKYVYDLDIVSEFSPLFIECLVLDIAIRMTKTFNDSTTYLQQLQMDFAQILEKAKVSDCRQTMITNAKPSELLSYMDF